MAKGRSLNLWSIAYIFAVAKGLSFDADYIMQQFIDAFLGDGDASLISAQIMEEIKDAITKIGTNPQQAAWDVGVNVGGVWVSKAVITAIFKAVGAPRSKQIGGFTVRWA